MTAVTMWFLAIVGFVAATVFTAWCGYWLKRNTALAVYAIGLASCISLIVTLLFILGTPSINERFTSQQWKEAATFWVLNLTIILVLFDGAYWLHKHGHGNLDE